jgi:hypothetical protein
MRLSMLLTVALCCGSITAASAADSIMHRTSCTLVRYYVARYSEGTAEAWARSKGATEADIDAARRCLGQTTITSAASRSQ